MNLALDEKYEDFRDEVKKFSKEYIYPYAKEADKNQHLPSQIIESLSSKGYICPIMPSKYGGQGFDNVENVILNEEIGGACSSTRSLMTVNGMFGLGILKWGTELQKEKYLYDIAAGKKIGAFALSEPNVGSDAKSINTTATESDDYYILNGHKKWITMAQIADCFIVFANCEGDKNAAFIVDRDAEGLTVEPINNLLGCRASMIGELIFDNCKIPKSSLLGKIGFGIAQVALTCLDYGRFSIACGCVGIAQSCLDESVKYSKERIQFSQPIKDNQLIQKKITEMVVNIKASRLLCLNAAVLKDNCEPDSIMETWNAKYFASTKLKNIVADAVQIHGANGISEEYNVERYYRDSIINEIIEGSTQVHEILISRNILNN